MSGERGLSEGAKEAGRPGVTALGGTALFSWGESAPPVGSFVTGLAPCNLRQTPRAPIVAGDRFRFRQLPSSTARCALAELGAAGSELRRRDRDVTKGATASGPASRGGHQRRIRGARVRTVRTRRGTGHACRPSPCLTGPDGSPPGRAGVTLWWQPEEARLALLFDAGRADIFKPSSLHPTPPPPILPRTK